MVTVLREIVTADMPSVSCWPPGASKTIRPIFPGAVMATLCVPPKAIRPVTCTSAAVYGEGGMKKSLVLTAFPVAVATEILPDPTPGGTLVPIALTVAELTVAGRTLLNVTLLLVGAV